MLTGDQCFSESECHVTSIIAVNHIIIPHRFGLYIRDEYSVFASYTMAMLNTIYDTPTYSPVDDSSRCSL